MPPYPKIPTAITPLESDLLAELTANRRVLEIGSYLGYSTVWMALNGSRVVAVDDHEWMQSGPMFRDNLKRYGVEASVELWWILSRQAASIIKQPFVDAVFIDGDHSYDSARFDCHLARRVIRPPGGWICVHDYSFPSYHGGGWPGVIQAVDEVLGDLTDVRRAGCLYAALLRLPERA